MKSPVTATRTRPLWLAALILTHLGFSTPLQAWGPDGHTATGTLAIPQLQAAAKHELAGLLGSVDGQSMALACNWPDAMRGTPAWDWSAPQHYVNLPRGDFSYAQARDCPGHMCATEAIKHYATVLGNRQVSHAKRWQAFAWICHLVGDLHQPLHAGFGDDRGGNRVDITFAGEPMNLHTFWDSALIKSRAGDWPGLVKLLQPDPAVKAAANWRPEMVDQWTNESHRLARTSVYPAQPMLDDQYTDRAWVLIQQRISLAATRLALLVNTVLKKTPELNDHTK